MKLNPAVDCPSDDDDVLVLLLVWVSLCVLKICLCVFLRRVRGLPSWVLRRRGGTDARAA